MGKDGSGFKSLLSSAFKRSAQKQSNKTPLGALHQSPMKQLAGAISPKKLFTPGSTSKKSARLRDMYKTEPEQASPKEGLIPAHTPQGLSSGDDNNIKVIVRVRPHNTREQQLGGAICVHPASTTAVQVATHPGGEPLQFTFDNVAPETTSQATMFALAGKPIVDNCLKGFNGCLLAYGQTGSGKTYTMLGQDDCHDVNSEGRGIIIRVFEHLFASMEKQAAQTSTNGEHRWTVRCSFLEIFQETVNDLLTGSANLALREDARKGVYVEGLTEIDVKSVDDVLTLVQQGVVNRRVGDTQMNERSSRSHSVFKASVERHIPGKQPGEPAIVLRSRLHLVDLAGSERQKASGAAGDRLKEASGINKSLSALGLVIMSLVDRQNGKSRHIPYRDSRLTFLLQDSLGGNAKTIMVATVSPATVNAAETISTLRFADSAKRIKNKAVVNEDAEGDAEALKKEIRRLKEELVQLRGQPGAGLDAGNISTAMLGSAAHNASGPEGIRRALLGALRREEAGAFRTAELNQELDEMRDLLAAKDADLQRTHMMLKLKESRLARASQSNGMSLQLARDETIAELSSEIELLKAKIEAHPEVKRFALENLHLSHEAARLRAAVDHGELAALQDDVMLLRRQVLLATEAQELAQEEAALRTAEADAAKAQWAEGKAQLEEALTKLREHETDPLILSRLETALKENDELRINVDSAAQLKKEYDALCAHAAGIESEKDKWLASAQRAQQEVEDLDRAYMGVLEELGVAWDDLGTAEEEVVDLKETLAHMKAATDQLKERYDEERKEAMSRITAGIEAAGELQIALDDKELEIVKLVAQVEAFKEMKSSLERVVSGHEKNIAELTQRATELSTEFEALQQVHNSSVEELESTKGLLATTEDKLSEETKLHAAVVLELQQATSKLDTTSAALKDTQTTLLQEQDTVATLRNQATEQAEVLARKQSALTSCQEQIKELQSALTAANEATEASQAEFQRLKSMLDDSMAAIAQKEAALKASEDVVTGLRQSVATALEESQALRSEINKKEDELKKAQHEMTEVEKKLQQAETTVTSTTATLELCRKELAESQNEVDDTKREVASLEARLSGAEEALNTANQQVDALKMGPLEKERQLLLVKAELDDLKMKDDKSKEEIQRLRTAVQGRDGEVSRLRAELANEVSDAAQQVQLLLAAQSKVEESERRLKKLDEKLKKETAERESLQTELEEERKHVVELTGQHNSQQRIKLHAKIKEENDTLRCELASAKDEAARNYEKYQRAVEELQRIKARNINNQ